MHKVFCLINGEGEIIKKTKDSVTVKFENGTESKANYTADGHLILLNGKKSPTKVLFEAKPKIVTDKALIDDLGNIIEDKDFVVYGSRESSSWKAGFFDAKNLSIFTTKGYRNPKAIFKQIDASMVLLKIDNEGAKEYKNNLKEEIAEFKTEEIQEIVEIENSQNEKTPEQEPSEQKGFLEVSIIGGEISCNYSGSQSVGDTVMIPIVDKKVKVDMVKNLGIEANAAITFNVDKIAKIINNKDERALKDYINLFDACVVSKKGQKNLNSSDVLYYIQNGKLMVDFKLN